MTTLPLRPSSKTPLGPLLRNTLPGSDQGRADLQTALANATGSGDGDLQLHKWVLQSATAALTLGWKSPVAFELKVP